MDFGVSARAIVIKDGHLLVESWDGGARTFLPGGRVEKEEDLATALKRELREEIGATDIQILNYVGSIESRWKEGDQLNFSFGHFFLVAWESGTPQREIRSPEQGREFCWIKLSDLDSKGLVPPKLRTLIPRLAEEGLTEEWRELDLT